MHSMGIFDKLKKGWGIGKTWGSKTSTQPEPARTPPPTHDRYGRLAVWIKTHYGNRFREGATSVEVEAQLRSILGELEAKGAFSKHPKIANGFRAYISERKYGDLVRISE